MKEKDMPIERIKCPHCSETLGVNQSSAIRALTDTTVTCPSCGRFIRKQDVIAAAETAAQSSRIGASEVRPDDRPPGASAWSPNVCWFCETGSAQDGVAVSVMFLKDEEKTYVGGGQYQYKAKGTTAKVPRCARCKYIHRARKIIPWVCAPILPAIMLGGIWALVRLLGGMTQWAGLGITIGSGALAVVAYSLASRFLTNKLAPDDKQTKNEFFKRYYPDVKRLEAEGWRLPG